MSDFSMNPQQVYTKNQNRERGEKEVQVCARIMIHGMFTEYNMSTFISQTTLLQLLGLGTLFK